jgi:hypothetical protein
MVKMVKWDGTREAGKKRECIKSRQSKSYHLLLSCIFCPTATSLSVEKRGKVSG